MIIFTETVIISTQAPNLPHSISCEAVFSLPTLADGVSGLFDKQALTIMPLWDCVKSNE